MADRTITIKVTGDASNFGKVVDGAADKAKGLGARLRNVGKGMVIGAGIGAFNLLNDALSFGISQIGDMREKFQTFEASQVRLGVALKNNIPNWDGNTAAAFKYAEAQKLLGFNATEVQDAIGQLIGVTHDLTKAEELVGLAEDLARSKGIDLATATDVVTKAYNGNSKGLKALGIDVTGATTGAELLAAAQRNVTTTAEQYATTSQGKQAVAMAKVEEAMIRIGKVIDQVAQVAIPILADAFEELIAGLDHIVQQVKDAIRWFQNLIRTAREFLNLDTGRGGSGSFGPAVAAPKSYRGNIIPTFHSGGIVPGAAGSDVLTMLQAGERVTPAGAGGMGQTIIVNIESFIGSDQDLDRFTDRIALRLRLAGVH